MQQQVLVISNAANIAGHEHDCLLYEVSQEQFYRQPIAMDCYDISRTFLSGAHSSVPLRNEKKRMQLFSTKSSEGSAP